MRLILPHKHAKSTRHAPPKWSMIPLRSLRLPRVGTTAQSNTPTIMRLRHYGLTVDRPHLLSAVETLLPRMTALYPRHHSCTPTKSAVNHYRLLAPKSGTCSNKPSSGARQNFIRGQVWNFVWSLHQRHSATVRRAPFSDKNRRFLSRNHVPVFSNIVRRDISKRRILFNIRSISCTTISYQASNPFNVLLFSIQ